ncbi:MAG: PASTA domain-containing protein [Bacteroidota bacterium]|nr:PASTA domain-containing protein [Bacteroidota bacterium]
MKIIKNLMVIFLLSLALIAGLFFFLNRYTRHNEQPIRTPDLIGLNVFEAEDLIEKSDLQMIVADTSYMDGKRKLEVIGQNPEAKLLVKSGRKIYLTINSDKIPKVRMPDLAGKTSLRQAKNMLRANGLVLAEVIERQDPSVEDEVNKPVLDQFLKGEKEAIKPNTEIPRLSKINLVVGVPIRNDTTLLEVDWE